MKSQRGLVFFKDQRTNDVKYINRKGEFVTISQPIKSLQNREMIEFIFNDAKRYTNRYFKGTLSNLLHRKYTNHCLWLNEGRFITKKHIIYDFLPIINEKN